MTTITEDYVSFEIAKLLKEKGFNAKCNKCYAYFADDDISCLDLKYSKLAQSLIANRYPCITLQMAMKWLREIHSIPINVLYDPVYYYHYKFQVCLGTKEKSNARRYDTYEQAAEEAIKYCLKKLIN